MKKIWILASFLALVATASFALPPSDAPVTLAAIFAPSTPNQSSAPGEEIVFAATMTKSICIASCGSGTTVSCSYTEPSTCQAVDRNCPSTQGYVTCNGVTTSCPSCPTTDVCTNGNTRLAPWTGDCCADNRRLRKRQLCVNGQWADTGEIFCGISCDGRDPLDPHDPQQ
jgi:hypothetical protein